MSLNTLIDNWVGSTKRHCFRVDESGAEDPTTFDLVFIATLWSGKSQLAFRVLSKVMDELTIDPPCVLVLDHDRSLPPYLVKAVPELQLASGCLLAVGKAGIEMIGTGEDKGDLERRLRERFST